MVKYGNEVQWHILDLKLLSSKTDFISLEFPFMNFNLSQLKTSEVTHCFWQIVSCISNFSFIKYSFAANPLVHLIETKNVIILAIFECNKSKNVNKMLDPIM